MAKKKVNMRYFTFTGRSFLIYFCQYIGKRIVQKTLDQVCYIYYKDCKPNVNQTPKIAQGRVDLFEINVKCFVTNVCI